MAFPVKTSPVKDPIPENWPEPIYNFTKNPLNKETIALGRKLFYDPILSKDNSISCSSCHLSYTAFTHVDHALSHGIHDSIGTRNSPVLVNLAWQTSFMWDGSVNHIEVQALAPISHPSEMGEDIVSVIYKLQNSDIYSNLFEQAFGDANIPGETLLKALAQFQLTLVSSNSKYDKVKRKEENISFSEQEKRGYNLFQKNCNSCHAEPLFTNGSFQNNGLPVDSFLLDYGRMNISLQANDSLKFKVPSLRNIEFSKPYMHDGRFTNLMDVMNHYSESVIASETLAPALKDRIPLSEEEKVDIIAFLLTLSDKSFLFNPDFAYPRN